MTRQNIINHQSRDTSVAIFKRMDTDVAIMKQSSKFHRRQVSLLFFFIILVHKIGHHGRGLFRRSIFKTITIASNDTVRSSFILSCVNHIACLHPTWKLMIYGVVLSKKSLVQRAYEILCERNILKTGVLLRHSIAAADIKKTKPQSNRYAPK